MYTWLSFGVCLCDLAGGGGWRGSTIFLVFSALLWRVSTIEMVVGAVFKFFTLFSLLLIALAGGYAR